MKEIIRVARLHPEGDPVLGLGPWQPITHDKVVSGTPLDRRHRFFIGTRRSAGQVRVGIWEAKAYTETLVDYRKDEFMVVLEGSVTVIEPDGREHTFVKGDSFFMPMGFSGTWRQDEPMKKYFMVFDPHDSGD